MRSNVQNEKLSVVVPCCNEEATLPLFCKTLHNTFAKLFSGDYDNVAMGRVSSKGEPPIRSFFGLLCYWS